MNALGREIVQMIAEDGPISLERFMALALTHPRHGYYTTRMPIGAAGDFTTAPEIHQMFGELVGLWAAATWQALGAPQPIRLVELGPGRGTLMADILRASRVVPAFHAALDIHLVETSAPLAATQKEVLVPFHLPITWHAHVETMPRGPAIIIANEFFDALPVRHYVYAQDGWHERLVGLDAEGRLAFGLAPEPEPRIEKRGAPGDLLELGLAAQSLVADLARRICADDGALLVIDYGYATPGRGETLQAVKSHHFADPLSRPGETDLTAHVDFAALARAAEAQGAAVHGPVAQGTWLSRLGIFERAAALKQDASPAETASIEAALTRLVDEEAQNMGALFKVLAVTRAGATIPAGFERESA
jgi:SAM-dependent MidA family methyltransferase